MTTGSIPPAYERDTPEGQELARMEAELEDLKAILVLEEADLASLVIDLAAFDRRYLTIVGKRWARLDQLHASIAVVRSQRDLNDPNTKAAAQEALKKAQHSSAAFEDNDENRPDLGEGHISSDGTGDETDRRELRDQYRDLARRSHPDLAVSEAERARRTSVMARINDAYRRGDGGELARIRSELNSEPGEVQGDGVASALVRTIRLLAQVRRRLQELEDEREELKRSSSFSLWEAAELARTEGRNLLRELADNIDAEASLAEEELADLLVH